MTFVRRSVISTGALTAFVALALGSGSATTDDHVGWKVDLNSKKPDIPGLENDAGFDITAVQFCQGVTAENDCVDPVEDYAASDTMHLCITLDGQVRQGVFRAVLMHQHDKVIELTNDLATMLPPSGGRVQTSTNLVFKVHSDKDFYVGEGYRFEVFANDTPVGHFETQIRRPPESSGPPQWRDGGVANGFDAAGAPIPIGTVTPQDSLVLWGEGVLGVGSWVEMTLWKDGNIVNYGRRYTVATQNVPNAPIRFPIAPKEGLDPGDWEIKVVMDGQEVARYPVTVTAGGSPPGR
ncbi:MAG: hypothetical protein AB8H79_05570 [Myxococcota bacterium]